MLSDEELCSYMINSFNAHENKYKCLFLSKVKRMTEMRKWMQFFECVCSVLKSSDFHSDQELIQKCILQIFPIQRYAENADFQLCSNSEKF